MKVCIDPGHGGKEFGAVGTASTEKNLNLIIALLFGEVLQKNGITVIFTRKTDEYVSLQDRCTIANKNKCNYFISFHCNSSGNKEETGSEVFCHHYGDQSEQLARQMLKTLVKINNNKDLGVKEGDFYALKNASMPSILIQIMYLSNPQEEKKLTDELWQRLIANELGNAFLSFAGIKSVSEDRFNNNYKTNIMGNSLAGAEPLENFLHAKNPSAPYFAKLYLSIGAEEGVRGDLAFTQALMETDFFNPAKGTLELHNYIGFKEIGSDDVTTVFHTPSDGIRAQIQHLKAYASTERLNTPLVDPLFHLVPRGIVTYWEDIDTYWINPKPNYGKEIVELWKTIINSSSQTNDPFDRMLSLWKSKGVLPENIDLEKQLTWREFLQVLNKLFWKE